MATRKRSVSTRSSGTRKRKTSARASPRKAPDTVTRLRRELAACKRELKEAHEQQTATAEILKVISSSPTDTRPVFDAILENACRLCDAHMANFSLYDGHTYLTVAQRGGNAEYAKWVANWGPHRPGGTFGSRMIAERRPIQIADLRDSSEYRDRVNPGLVARVELGGARTLLAVPMFKEGQFVGAITIYRPEVRPFSQKQIDLVSTFANQAVIAIENVRLFNETKEALEQQTVISEILRVISSSPTDTQPVFDAIVRSGLHLFGGMRVVLRLVNGDHLETVARSSQESDGMNPAPLDDDSRPGVRAVLRREIVQVPDILAADEWVSAASRQDAKRRGFRAVMHAPMLRQGMAIGTIMVSRATPGSFTDKQVALLKTFADQAVIAIENVRLFKELEARNAEVTVALEQQTATSEILRIISSSPTDTQPVFDAIVRTGLELFGGTHMSLRLVRGEYSEVVAATYNIDARDNPPIPITEGKTIASQAILSGEIVHVPDLIKEGPRPEYAARRGIAACISVPLLRNRKAIGAITLGRPTPGAFTDKQIALLKTFADQAVIAIENVRLFKELQARNAEVTEALEQQTATADILKVISSSPTDIQPVLDAVAQNAARLCDAIDVIVRRVDGAVLRVAAHFGSVPVVQETVEIGIRRGVGRAFLERRTIHIHDIDSDQARAEYPASLAESHHGSRWRTMLVVPLMRESSAIGTIAVRRPEVRPFSDKQIELLETFASQAVIAIENVRLFKELQARNAEITESLEQQTATAEVLKVISSSPTDIQPVFDAILESATRLCRAHMGILRIHDGKGFARVAQRGVPPEYAKWIAEEGHKYAALPNRDGSFEQMVTEGRPVHVLDRRESSSYRQGAAGAVAQVELGGARSFLAVPLFKEGRVLGGIVVMRPVVEAFTQKQIDLLSTFAAQAVIAIENVRLFNEIQDKSRQLEVASRHKSDFLAHMSHELRTPLNAVIGFSEALLARMFGELNAKQDEYLNDIHSSGHHLLSLINDILDLSKIEAGRMELEVSEFHLPAALQNALTLVRERAQNHGIALQLEIDARLQTICADERKVKQIVLNLLSNAVKFTPDGGRVEVDARMIDSSAEISVKDTGPGIAADDQATLFEEFRQVGRDRARKQEGTGLGLALTRRFVELHGGRIRLESALGKGSTFTFTLPLQRQA